MAVQPAEYAGAHGTATASPRSADVVRELGADEVVGYGRRSGRPQGKVLVEPRRADHRRAEP
ncbi:hypothetical protein ACRAKI_02275 [Saccharothrix isguenensis]